MIGLKIGNEVADVLQDTKISLELNNPLLGEDSLSPGSISYPFSLPCGDDSPKNSTLLGVPDVIENAAGARKIDADLLVGDVPFRSGKLIVREYPAGKTRAQANFNFGVIAAFGQDFKTKKLADILDEAVTIWTPASHSPAWYKEIYLKPIALIPELSITVNGRVYSSSPFTLGFSAFLDAIASQINSDTSEPRASATVVTSGTSHQGMVAPYLIVKPYSNSTSPISPLSVNFEGNGFDEASYRWHVHGFDPTEYDNVYKDFYSDNFEDPRFSFPAVKNDNPYGEAVEYMYFRDYYSGFGSFAGGTKITNDVNRATAGVLRVNDPNWGYNNDRMFVVENINSLQPFVRMRHVLNKIADHFGFSYEGDFTTLADIDEMYIWNTAPLDVPMDFIGSKKFVFFRSAFNIKELVPDMTVRDFFLALASRYNLGLELNERNNNLVIYQREPIARAIEHEDITPLCGQPKGQEDIRVTGFRMVCEKDTTDQVHYTDQLEIDTPEDTVKVLCRAFKTATPNPQVLVNQKMGAKVGLSVFYMRYPSDSGTGVGAASPLSGAWVESLGGEDGIYETFWKYWLYFRQRRRVITLPVTWHFRHLNDLVWKRKYRFNGNNYLVKKVTVDIGAGNEIGVSEVQLYSMV